MNRPDAVIFDLDGCLVDSEPMSLSALAAEMRACGVSWATPEAMRDRYLGMTATDFARDVARFTGRPCPPGFIADYLGRLYRLYAAGVPRIGPMVAVLDRLQDAGIATCIASGSGLERIRHTLDLAGLAGRFDGCAFSGEEVDRGKPAPDLVLHAARALGVAPGRCVVIEDSPHGIRGAVAAGMRSIGFTGGSHLDGIRDAHSAALAAAGADIVVQDASRIGEILLDPAGAGA